ncbi:MAG: hypothetical protein KAY24_15775, partial [Candidatus Eisenbacteria sp.]|nr:hypothetical protein [Candidatus Eisenbacteria bacterium]
MRVRISVFLVMYLCLLAISPAGAEGRSSGYGVSPPFHLDTRHNLADLYLYPEDISWTSVGGGNVQITAVIYNTGKSASNVGVRFLQSDMSQGLGQAAPIAQDQWIAQIDSAGSAQVQVQWAPPSDDRMLYVIADPTDQIAEDVESNNTAQKPYSGEGPVIAAITAHWDGLEEDDRIGMFITGIEAYNTIEAQVEDANGPDDVQLVVFRTEDDVIRVEDTNGADGWSAQIDMGLVSYPKRLIVEAQDAQGLWGSRAVQLEGITIPEWLSGGDAVVEAFVFEEGIYDCEIRFPGEPVPSNSQVPDSVLLLGGLRNDLQTQLKAAAHYFIEGYGRIGGGGVIEGGVLQSESYGPNLELDVEVGAQLNEQFELMGIYAGANASLAFPIPEVEHGWPIMVAGIPIWISISVGGDVTILVGAEYVLNTNLEFIDGTHITPGLGIHVVLTAAIEILFGIAELRFVGEPMAQIELTVEYTTQTGASSSWCGSFIVPYAIWGSIGWGLWEEELYSSALPAPGEPWEFGDCGALMTERLRQRYARGGVFRAPRPPEIFPDPDLTAGSGDKVVVVWVSDRDPNPEAVNPEVYSMFRSGNTWSDPSPVTSNALFETNPVVAYLPDGLPMALWTQNNLAQRDSASFAATLENQEIYCSLWSAEDSTWSEAVEITTDDPGQLGDGMVQGAFGADNVGLCVWVRTTDDDLETRTDWEIFFASWIDSTAWSPPDPITNDAAADCSPNVAILPDGRGLAVWLRDDDTDFSTTDDTHIVYAIWDGTTWTPPSALSTSGSIKQDPRLAVTPSGRAMVTWMETVAFADSAKADSVRVIISDPGVTGWGPIQTAVGSDHFLQRPQPHVARVRDSEIAMVAWRGHDGYDGDLFASMLDLSEPLAEWTEPTAILSDTLTDWMATSAIDSLGNALFFSVKTDWSDGRGRPAVGTMTDGLSFMAKGVKPNLEFGDELNFGALPVAPDLDLRGENIWFTVDEDTVLYAGEGDLIEVHARVINAGDVESAESAVRFFDAHPDSSGGQIGADQLLPVLPPDTAHETRIEWTAVGGVHQLFAWADPDSGQAEQGEDNNLASAILYITPDMSADSLSFSKSNPLLGDPITLTAHIS